ncbi:MAG: amidophosphoribosyltransferase [Coriobacteriia bacterium]|nr:amidophosphoribosyltransferase [Coriobacteriia bacterium]
MGGFFGVASTRDAVVDVFFGVDFHSHLGTKRAGMVAHHPDLGFQRDIHTIDNTPFRTRFEPVLDKVKGNTVIGCISDKDPQPLLFRSHLGVYALTTVGVINNADELIETYLSRSGGQFSAMGSGEVNQVELVASLINQKDTLVEGLRFAQETIEGSMTMLLMTEHGEIYAARDRFGRLPVLVGKDESGYCVTFESFVYDKLGYTDAYELGPNEIVRITAQGLETVAEAGNQMRICAFLWTYYGYPNSTYEGTNVEVMRYRNGEIMARDEAADTGIPDVDYVGGIPDSGLPHAIGYSTKSGKTFARPFVKYTPTWSRSFMPSNQEIRNHVAKMKQVPVPQLIDGKKLLLVDDSIVRGTQLRETVEFLYGAGAKEVHMRSACPPLMYGCKYLNFSSSKSEMELIARRKVDELEGEEGLQHLDEYADATTERGKCLLKSICEEMGFDSLRYQSLEGHLEAIGIDPAKVCTYCWSGRE